MVSTGRPSDPYEEVITITSKSVDHRSHAYGTCATNGGQPRIRCSIGKKFRKSTSLLFIFIRPMMQQRKTNGEAIWHPTAVSDILF